MLHNEPEKIPEFDSIELDYPQEKIWQVVEDCYDDYENSIHTLARHYIETLKDSPVYTPPKIAEDIGKAVYSEIVEVTNTFEKHFSKDGELTAACRVLGKRAMQNGDDE